MSHYMDGHTYILVDRKPVKHPNNDEWWKWYTTEGNRRVAWTEIGDVAVSTVFTSLDIRPSGLLFETKIFGGEYDQHEWESATWEEAEAAHERAVAFVQQGKGR